MQVLVNGVRLFFDVEGAKLVPDGPVMREKPTLLLLHGGPGFDHSIYKPAYSALADIAQIVYLDHRGNGRSEDGPLARISHSVEAHRGANQRKLLCSNDFSLIQGAPRCRQSVAQNDLILEWWKVGLWKRPLMAGW